MAIERGASEVCVIGGASLFALALTRARRIYLTDVDAEVAGDPASAADDHPFTIRVLER